MTLYKVQYYKERENDWMADRRSMLVMADDEETALDYVEENAEDFVAFPWDHNAARVITEKEWHKA